MKPLATSQDILQGEVDTFAHCSLLPTIVYLTECMEKKREKLKESEKVAFISLVDAITEGIYKRFCNIMGNEKVMAFSKI